MKGAKRRVQLSGLRGAEASSVDVDIPAGARVSGRADVHPAWPVRPVATLSQDAWPRPRIHKLQQAPGNTAIGCVATLVGHDMSCDVNTHCVGHSSPQTPLKAKLAPAWPDSLIKGLESSGGGVRYRHGACVSPVAVGWSQRKASCHDAMGESEAILGAIQSKFSNRVADSSR